MSERSVSRSNECDATINEPSGVPNRPVGCSLSKAGSSFLIPCLVMLEGKIPGAIPLTEMFLPASDAARIRVTWFAAALEVASARSEKQEEMNQVNFRSFEAGG